MGWDGNPMPAGLATGWQANERKKAIGETTHYVANGACPAWGFRAWVMTGVDIGVGVNVFDIPVTFLPVGGTRGARSPYGFTGPDGRYELTYDNDHQGAPEGAFEVLCNKWSNGHIVGDDEAMKLRRRDYEPGWEPKV